MAVDTTIPEVTEFRHVLVAGDSSPSAKRAVAVAARLASQTGAKLTILHVMRKMQVPEELLDMADVEKIVGVRGDLLVYVGNKILRAAQEIAAANGYRRAETVLGDGDPAGVIVAEAEARGADLIVVGTRGLGTLKTTLMGSVSRKVANLADTNVMVVK